LFVTPAFHHWHHSDDPAHYDKNFASQWPIMDWLFGTMHFPKNEWPASYGLAPGAEPVPSGYIQRLLWPLSVDELRVRPGRVAVVIGAVALGSGGAAYAGTIEPDIGNHHLHCRSDEIGIVTVDPLGIVISDPSGTDVTTVRDFETDPTGELSFRVVRDGGVPLSAWISPKSLVDSDRTVTFIGPEGEFLGSCRDLPLP
jgi:hypothetical protein